MCCAGVARNQVFLSRGPYSLLPASSCGLTSRSTYGLTVRASAKTRVHQSAVTATTDRVLGCAGTGMRVGLARLGVGVRCGCAPSACVSVTRTGVRSPSHRRPLGSSTSTTAPAPTKAGWVVAAFVSYAARARHSAPTAAVYASTGCAGVVSPAVRSVAGTARRGSPGVCR